MHDADAILARFPGPVTLSMTRRKKLLGLVFFLGIAALFTWLLFIGADLSRRGSYGPFMAWLTVAVCAGMAMRTIVLLVDPGSASLVLDAGGFTHKHVFNSKRTSWRDVDDFQIETVIGKLGLIRYHVLARGAGARGQKRVTRHLADTYGLPTADFARLMTAWRQRALAHTPTSVPLVSSP